MEGSCLLEKLGKGLAFFETSEKTGILYTWLRILLENLESMSIICKNQNSYCVIALIASPESPDNFPKVFL